MSHAVTALITFILTFLLVAGTFGDLKKDYVSAGHMIVGGKAYRVIPADSQ